MLGSRLLGQLKQGDGFHHHGAVCNSPPIGVVNAVCRDEQGMYLGASALVFHGLTDPNILETLACRETLALERDMLFQNIIVASECLQAVNDINSGTNAISAPIIREIKEGVMIFRLSLLSMKDDYRIQKLIV
ncbi:hypothetical protein D1007_16849 [Hordeum vulgare]|nr:hypothetical protein D1007_16849 [Hordeum vulgare]